MARTPGRVAVGTWLAPDLHHAAGGIAIQRRERATHDLHGLAAQEVEVRKLPLAIGHGCRDAVGIQPQAAHAEGGARAEAANGELRILRVVLPVQRNDARNPHQRFRHVDQRPVAVAVQLHGVDRRRHIDILDVAQPGGADLDGVQGRTGSSGFLGMQCTGDRK